MRDRKKEEGKRKKKRKERRRSAIAGLEGWGGIGVPPAATAFDDWRKWSAFVF